MDEWTLNDLLECSVCLERLDTSSKVLPCQHTFCRKCLEEIVSTHRELRCPECRVLVDVKIDELPPNVLLMRILEGMRNAAPRKRAATAPASATSNSQSSLTQTRRELQTTAAATGGGLHGPPSAAAASSLPKHTLPPNQPYARAIYDYLSNEPGDLRFKKGDIILLRKKYDTNWCHGETCGHHGIFPLAYVQVIVPLPNQIPQCTAQYDFRMSSEEEEGCLTFNKGEIITVIRRVDENWAEGKLADRIGIFPLAFVELNSIARALMKLSSNSQPGPSRVAPPTPTSEDTTPLIPTSTTAVSVCTEHHSSRNSTASAAAPQQPAPSCVIAQSDSSSTVSSVWCMPAGSSSTTTPNTSSSNTSSSSSTAPSSPTSPPPPRPTTSSTNSSKRQHGINIATPQHRHSAEILSPGDEALSEVIPIPVRGEVHSSHHRRTSDLLQAPPPPPQAGGIASCLPVPALYKALYPYKPQKADELELHKGGIYLVTERCQDGWFKGTLSRTTKTGVFPGNYVTPAMPITNHSRGARTNGTSSGSGGSPRNSANSNFARTSSKQNNLHLTFIPRATGQQTANLQPPELPPRSASPSIAHISSSWHGPPQDSGASASISTQNELTPTPLGRSRSAVMAAASTSNSLASPQITSIAAPPNVSMTPSKNISASASITGTPAKEKKERSSSSGVSLMRRLTSIKKSKSPPPPTTYSMDNPVFEDTSLNTSAPAAVASIASPAHPVHVRSGSCPSQLLQSLPMDGCHIAATGNETSVGQTVLRAHHRLFGGSSGGGSARIKHKERSNIVVANFAHRSSAGEDSLASAFSSGLRINSGGSGSGSGSSHQHRKSNSMDASGTSQAMESSGKTSKQLVPPVRERFRCIVAYPPNSEHELELRVGDIIYVHKKREDGWYKGTQQRTGRTGLFPASFVEGF